MHKSLCLDTRKAKETIPKRVFPAANFQRFPGLMTTVKKPSRKEKRSSVKSFRNQQPLTENFKRLRAKIQNTQQIKENTF